MARFFILLVATLVSVQGNAVDRVSSPGWTTTAPTEAPTTTTTSGWSSPPTEAPTTTTPGWNAPPPPPPNPGWGAPHPPSNVTVGLDGSLASTGSGSAAESHSENIHVTGGWGVPADLAVAIGGESVVSQEGSIYQITNVDSETASSVNAVTVGQVAAADESLAVIASGLDVYVGQNGWAGATGEGSSGAAADTVLVVNK